MIVNLFFVLFLNILQCNQRYIAPRFYFQFYSLDVDYGDN
jgi:hypothetical protein